MTVEIERSGGKKTEDDQRQTVRIVGGGYGLAGPITTFPIHESGIQPLQAERTKTGQTEAPREENWILRLYGLLGLAELRRKFPHGTYSAIGEYASKGAISEIDSPDQDTK